jgi:hypothetical protein
MDQGDDPRELERKIEQAARIASRVTDKTTVERLRAWIQELMQRRQQRSEARRTKHQITARAHELWDHNGRRAGRDLEFWLKAESEINERDRQ